MEILNKIDLLEPSVGKSLVARNSPIGPIAISALTGEGLPDLLSRFEQVLGASETVLNLRLDSSDGAGLAWIYEHARVLKRADRANGVHLTIAVAPNSADRFRERFKQAS